MKYYVYISKSKIDMLYGQIADGEDVVEYSLEGGASIGVAQGKGVRKSKRTTSLYHKLDTVLDKLNNVGCIHGDSEYIQGSLMMSWNMKKKINANSNATFWMGESLGEGSLVSKILLIGSFHNIIGNDSSSSSYYSTSYIDAFFEDLEKTIDFESLECVSPLVLGGKASDDKKELDTILKKHNNDLPPAIHEFLKSSMFNRDLAKYIDELESRYYGEYCEYEFTAKFLHSELRYVEDTLVRYIVATPIYVSLCTQRGNRVVINKEQKKYLLTPSEFKQHRKHNYKSLHIVLYDAGLKKESELFTAEMEKLYDSVGSAHGLLNRTTRRTFIESATTIANKYFIVM